MSPTNVPLSTQPQDSEEDDQEIEPMMAVSGGPLGLVNKPIHESLTLSAAISVGVTSPGTTLSSASGADWELIRGAIWNDDPELLLFMDSPSSNSTHSTGLQWLKRFKEAAPPRQWSENNPGDMRNPTGRSHYGDLQFLHSMANSIGEKPHETKRKILIWLEVMYKLAIAEEGITENTLVKDTKLAEFCPPVSLPPRRESLRYLLSLQTSFTGIDIQRRAIGSMFHIIQDSYAIGHTQRELLNPQDRIGNDLKFKSGVADDWGAILNFHTYGGQDGTAHAHFDHAEDNLPDEGHLDNLDQWNGMVGCRSAVDKCIGLLRLKQAGTKWDEGVRQYFEEKVFALSPNATDANNSVDSH